MQRGEIWWADLGEAVGSSPAYRRPVLIIQCDEANRSRLATVICAALSSNLRLASLPGNVLVPQSASSLPKDSVVNVSQLITLDKDQLRDHVGVVAARTMAKVDVGLKRQLALW